MIDEVCDGAGSRVVEGSEPPDNGEVVAPLDAKRHHICSRLAEKVGEPLCLCFQPIGISFGDNDENGGKIGVNVGDR